MPFNRLNHSILGEIRPRFALKISGDQQTAIDHVEKCMTSDTSVSSHRSDHLIFLRSPSEERHYWSPEMTVRIETEEYTESTTVSCLVGPVQSVWALWAFIYSVLLKITVFGGIFGLVQYGQEGSSPWIWVIPIGIILLSTAFIVSKLGQRKDRDQMLHLVSFLYHNLDQIGEVDRHEISQ
jgi:hypothetical protein